MKNPISCSAALILLVCARATPAASQVIYVDRTNPTGLPDLYQGREGVCAAAAAGNILWNFSGFAGVKGSSPPLVSHSKENDFAFDWEDDGKSLVQKLADEIYGPVHPRYGRVLGEGQFKGVLKYVEGRKWLYDAKKKPDGFSMIEITGAAATYSRYKKFAGDNTARIIGSWRWHNPKADGFLLDGSGQVESHALTAAGWDTADKFVLVSNSWDNHEGKPKTPVSTDYYDQYTIRTTGDKLRIYGDDNKDPKVDLVHGIDFSKDVDYVEMWRMWGLKRGAGPITETTVTPDKSMPDRMLNRFSYSVTNPDADPLYNFYLEVASPYVAQALLTAMGPLGWTAELWIPDRDKFGPDICSPEGVDPAATWSPDWTGIHWFTSTNPLSFEQTDDFSFLLPDTVPFSLDGVNLEGTGQIDDQVLSFSLTGGPESVPEPRPTILAVSLIASGVGVAARRHRGADFGARRVR